jgi:hypothetical protein
MENTRVDKDKHTKIIMEGLSGKSAESIAIELGLTKSRVCQILKKYSINTRQIRNEARKIELNNLANKANKLLSVGLSVEFIRNNLKLNSSSISELHKLGADLRVVKKEEIKKRNETCLNLYKKGLTAYEIIDIVPEVTNPNQVYKNICTVNNFKLPKRKNSRVKKSDKLKKEIFKLKKTNTFNEVTNLLNEKGVTNLNGGKIKIGSVINTYYRNR